MRGFIRGGHAWFYLGGMHGFIWGACMVLFRGGMHGFIWGGHVWFYLGGACMVLFRGAWFDLRGHTWFYSGGACVVFSVFSDTMRYGQWAGGTHPTGMHSCFFYFHLVFGKLLPSNSLAHTLWEILGPPLVIDVIPIPFWHRKIYRKDSALFGSLFWVFCCSGQEDASYWGSHTVILKEQLWHLLWVGNKTLPFKLYVFCKHIPEFCKVF